MRDHRTSNETRLYSTAVTMQDPPTTSAPGMLFCPFVLATAGRPQAEAQTQPRQAKTKRTGSHVAHSSRDEPRMMVLPNKQC